MEHTDKQRNRRQLAQHKLRIKIKRSLKECTLTRLTFQEIA